MKSTFLATFVSPLSIQAGFSEAFFTQTGTDLSFEEVLKSGKLPKGSISKDGVTGSRINMPNRLVGLAPEAR